MKLRIAVPVALASMSAAWAATTGTSMKFIAVPASQTQGAAKSSVAQARHDDQMVVIVKEPAVCGERLTDGQYTLRDNVLHLSFHRPAADGQSRNCVATGIFSLKGLPNHPISVMAESESTGTTASNVAQSDSAAGPMLNFISGAAKAVEGFAQNAMQQVRKDDQLVAVVKQQAACGSKLTDPSVFLVGNSLTLRYNATAPNPSEGACVATGVFSVKGLPPSRLTTVAEARVHESAAQTAVAAAPAPKMSFVAVPAIAEAQSLRPGLEQVRNGDTLNVVLHEAAPCGERLQAGAYQLENGRLSVHYQVPAAQEGDAQCMATAMIMFRGLPQQDIHVVAISEPAPAAQRLAMDRGHGKFD